MSRALGDFPRNAEPVSVRRLLDNYYRLLDALDDMNRADGASLTLQERVARRLVRAEIVEGIDKANRFLTRVARRGGRGIPAAPAPESAGGNGKAPGCRGGAPAVMGHGCPALASAVGPAPTVSQGHAIASPADPLLLGPAMQKLPVAGLSLLADIISTKEAESCA